MVRDLTMKTDRLPAIAGLAKEFGRLTEIPSDSPTTSQYHCGLWEKDFIRGLYWKGNGARISSNNPSKGESEYAGPTWSWVSLGTHENLAPIYDFLIEDMEWDHVVNKNRTAKLDKIYVLSET